jgi:hypothetical protein
LEDKLSFKVVLQGISLVHSFIHLTNMYLGPSTAMVNNGPDIDNALKDPRECGGWGREQTGGTDR